jgi:hypothetical protein
MTRVTIVAAVAILLLAPNLTLAQSAAPNPQVPAGAPATPAPQAPGRAAMAACRTDMLTLCGPVERGGGRKFACLKENQAKLSPACQSAIQIVLEKNHRAPTTAATPNAANGHNGMKACQADTAAVCTGVDKGKGRLLRCLQEHATKLSAGCRDALQNVQSKRLLNKQARVACAADQASLCPSAAKGPPAMKCLREKAAQASPGCQQALAAVPRKN